MIIINKKEYSRKEVQDLIDSSTSWYDLVINKFNYKSLNTYPNTILIKNGFDISKFGKYKIWINNIEKISNDEFINIVKNSNTMRQIAIKCNIEEPKKQTINIIKKRINELNIDDKHIQDEKVFKHYQMVTGFGNCKYTLDEILVKNSKYHNSTCLKNRLMKEKNWKNECSICHITEWNNKPIVMHLDHINGEHTDNRIENIRLLCPNCHSQTSNYTGKNINYEKLAKEKYINNIVVKDNKYCSKCNIQIDSIFTECQECRYKDIIEKKEKAAIKIFEKSYQEKKIKSPPIPDKYCIDCNKSIAKTAIRCNDCNNQYKFKESIKNKPTYNQLKEDLSKMNYTQVGKKYNVSDNCIRKWLKKYELHKIFE